MSGNASISAAIRRRGVEDNSSTGRNRVISNNLETNNQNRRRSYLEIMVNHEERLKDVEVLMQNSLLPTQEEQSTSIETILKMVKEINVEITNIKDKLNNMDLDTISE